MGWDPFIDLTAGLKARVFLDCLQIHHLRHRLLFDLHLALKVLRRGVPVQRYGRESDRRLRSGSLNDADSATLVQLVRCALPMVDKHIRDGEVGVKVFGIVVVVEEFLDF